jgi:hypothetical protein
MPVRLTAALLLALTAAAGPARAGFAGQTVGATYNFPDLATVNNNLGAAVVGAGVEFTQPLAALVFLDLSDTNILITSNVSPPAAFITFTGSVDFNGFVFRDVNGTIPAITGADVNPATTARSGLAPVVTFDADRVFVNLRGVNFAPGEQVLIDVRFAPSAVPAPPAVLIAGIGLLALVGVRRIRPRAA